MLRDEVVASGCWVEFYLENPKVQNNLKVAPLQKVVVKGDGA